MFIFLRSILLFYIDKGISKQTRGIHPMPFQCWSTAIEADTTLKQHWVNVPCVLGIKVPFHIMNSFNVSTESFITIYVTREAEPVLLQCYSIVCDAGPTLNTGSISLGFVGKYTERGITFRGRCAIWLAWAGTHRKFDLFSQTQKTPWLS